MIAAPGSVVVLSGGVGGAKLVLGLDRILGEGQLAVVANTGDDFEHFGLAISPDLDTVMYTLAGCVNAETGWGLRDETWNCMEALATLGADTWFRLGDRDLATHLERTRRLKTGQSLTEVTRALCARLSVTTDILPMSDDPVRTRVLTDDGPLDFQHYFVRDQAMPRVTGLEYAGSDAAEPTREVLEVLRHPDLSAIIVAPSNPFLSIDPILAIPGLAAVIRATAAPVIAISPIVRGMAIKGPTAKIMAELGHEASARAVARHYRGLVDGFILDSTDGKMLQEIEAEGLKATSCNTIMESIEDKIRVARASLEFADTLKTVQARPHS